ncbi:hypothetical protein GCM10028806_33710 [Spirosoma terrae]|uniref:Uncharacterized protein n=1 Tax=Spirosoma terrae TaxID=1968276 RepID=A0A6L9LA50_9BACT|nr:hypothetical protein [Spirosoma terrae]NDU95683.1 hypothetical protein [Spirosoma terrae]
MAQVFELIRDERVTIWHRYSVSVEADNMEEAVNKLKGDGSLGYDWASQPGIVAGPCVPLWDTEELTEPQELGSFGSIEITLPDDNQGGEPSLLWSNAKYQEPEIMHPEDPVNIGQDRKSYSGNQDREHYTTD